MAAHWPGRMSAIAAINDAAATMTVNQNSVVLCPGVGVGVGDPGDPGGVGVVVPSAL